MAKKITVNVFRNNDKNGDGVLCIHELEKVFKPLVDEAVKESHEATTAAKNKAINEIN